MMQWEEWEEKKKKKIHGGIPISDELLSNVQNAINSHWQSEPSDGISEEKKKKVKKKLYSADPNAPKTFDWRKVKKYYKDKEEKENK